MKPRARLLCLLAIACAGLAAAVYDAGGEPEESTLDRLPSNTPAAAPAGPPALLQELAALKLAREQPPAGELFAAKSWYVAPPPPPSPPQVQAPVAPLKPSAPPLPFTFMGKIVAEDRLTVFLVKGERVFLAAEGDVIDGTYKLEKIEPGQLTLRYLPLETVQTLAVGEAR